MSRTFLVLGGGPLAVPALRFAREAGLATVLAAPEPLAAARHLADEHHATATGAADAHRDLVRRLARAGSLAGIHATDAAGRALLPALADASDGALAPRDVLADLARDGGRAHLDAAGLAVARDDAEGARAALVALGFFRDGGCVPCGVARRGELDGDPVCTMPALASGAGTRAVHALAERAARAAGLARGPFQVTLAETARGLALVRVDAGFADAVLATLVAPLAYGKSPLQAWLAHLADAGGPFDELPLAPRAHAGWLAPRAAPDLGGAGAVARARAVAGVAAAWVGPRHAHADAGEPPALLVAHGADAAELEDRLRRARAALEVHVACRVA